jgi:hypothetical protein
VLGLNISSAFKSAVTVYVVIPLLLIPQMILSGLLFNFDKLNDLISTKGKVPMVADLMASRWSYEALATSYFIDNEFEKSFYQYEKAQSQADFKSAFLIDELRRMNQFSLENLKSENDSIQQIVNYNLLLIASNLYKDEFFKNNHSDVISMLEPGKYSESTGKTLDKVLDEFKAHNQEIYNQQTTLLEKKMAFFESNGWSINKNKDAYYNQSLADLVQNINTKARILEADGKLIQQVDPIFQDPTPTHALDYSTGFFFPTKNALGISISTYWFNLAVVWLMSIALYITLYFESLKKLLNASDTIRSKKFFKRNK